MRKKTIQDYEHESKKIGKCLVHPNTGSGFARKIYQLRHGKLPSSEICVCHTCDVWQCIDDNHHFLGTQIENVLDSKRKGTYKVAMTRPEVRAAASKARKAVVARMTTQENTALRRTLSAAHRAY